MLADVSIDQRQRHALARGARRGGRGLGAHEHRAARVVVPGRRRGVEARRGRRRRRPRGRLPGLDLDVDDEIRRGPEVGAPHLDGVARHARAEAGGDGDGHRGPRVDPGARTRRRAAAGRRPPSGSGTRPRGPCRPRARRAARATRRSRRRRSPSRPGAMQRQVAAHPPLAGPLEHRARGARRASACGRRARRGPRTRSPRARSRSATRSRRAAAPCGSRRRPWCSRR